MRALALAVALLPACSRPPAARLEVVSLPASPDLRLWCRHRGLHPPVTVAWHLGVAMRVVTSGPRDQEFIHVAGPGPSPRPGLWEVRCEATDVDGVKVEAATSLLAPTLREATLDGVPVLTGQPRASRGVLSLLGSELGNKRGAEDGVWLVPTHGSPVALSIPIPAQPPKPIRPQPVATDGGVAAPTIPVIAGCPSVWTPTQITGCLPSLENGAYEIRVQTGGQLVRLPQTLVVAGP